MRTRPRTIALLAAAGLAAIAVASPPVRAQADLTQRYLFLIWQQLLRGPVPVAVQAPVQVMACPPNPLTKKVPPLC